MKPACLRNTARLDEARQARSSALVWLPMEDRDVVRALEVQTALLRQGLAIAWAALVVSAVSERHQVDLG